MTSRSRFAVLSLAVGAGALTAAACADKHYHVAEESEPAVVEKTTVVTPPPVQATTTETVTVQLAPEAPQIVRQYYIERGCPEGLVQQGQTCVVPNVVTHRYVVGQPLPQEVIIVDLPADLVATLPVLPTDYKYRIVDGDLVVVRESTRVILDANDLY